MENWNKPINYGEVTVEKCVICGCNFLRWDMKKITNNYVCVHCISAFQDGFTVKTTEQALALFAKKYKKECWDYSLGKNNPVDVLIDFMRKKGYSYNSWNYTFEK